MGKNDVKITMDMTLKEILEDERISEIAKDAISKWDLSKEEFYGYTLSEIAENPGWNNIQRGFTTLFDAASEGKYYYSLYSNEECANAPEKESRNIIYLPADDENAKNKPFILIAAGGAFVNVWSLTEAWPTAQIFNELGYNVFVLTYQVGVDAAAVKAMEDMAKAMKIIHDNADSFNVNPDNYITCGFSAGGYVVGLWNTEKGYSAFGYKKPAACFPIYPVTSYQVMRDDDLEEEIDKDEFALSGVGCTLEEACNSCFDLPTHVQGFPPTAIFVASKDELVNPEHSKRLAKALTDAGIECRLEVGPTGGHGFADGTGMCMEGWPKRAIEWFENR